MNNKSSTISPDYIIGVYSIFINKYVQYYESFIQNINQYFFPNNKKIFYIVSDIDLPIIDNSEIYFIKKPYIGWPYETLYRFKYFLSFNEDDVKKSNVIYFFNSNARCNNIIENIIPNENGYVFTIHHGFLNKLYLFCTYEKNIFSTAYVPNKKNMIYIAGGFFGAMTDEFIKMSKILDINISNDEKNNIIACWHDESHLNWYYNIYLKSNCTLLDISYHIPEEKK